MKGPLYLLAAALLGLALPAPGLAGERAVEVYPIGFADPDSTRAALEALVGSEGMVVIDEKFHRAIVSASPAEQERVAEFLEKLEVSPRNIRIEVAFEREGTERASSFGVTGEGGVVISEGGTSGRVVLRPHLEDQATDYASRTRQSLLVASGAEARLAVGEEIPYLEWLVGYALEWGYLAQRVDWRQVGAFLAVRAEVLGDSDRVLVRCTPELSGRTSTGHASTRFARAATEVVVRSGETVRIGGLEKDDEFYRRFLFGRASGGSRGTLDILLTPHIVDTAGTRGGASP